MQKAPGPTTASTTRSGVSGPPHHNATASESRCSACGCRGPCGKRACNTFLPASSITTTRVRSGPGVIAIHSCRPMNLRRLAGVQKPRLDYRRCGLGSGITLMRHAGGALALPVTALALGVVAPAVAALLVLSSRRPQALAPPLRRARPAAVALPTVTIRTEANPAPAPLTTHRPKPYHSQDRTEDMDLSATAPDPGPAESYPTMSRKKNDRQEKNWRRQLEKKRQDAVVNDSAATLSCAAEAAGDFAYQCTHQQEELDFDLPYLYLALEIWRESPMTPPSLLAALNELLAEQLRHRETLIRLGLKLEQLAADPSLHIHLDPIDHYRELVRNRLFADPPTD